MCSCGADHRQPLLQCVLQICVCKACRDLQGDAAADGEFMTIAAASSSAGSTAAVFAPIAAASGRRRLLQTTNDEVGLLALAWHGRVCRCEQDWAVAGSNGFRV